MSLTAPAFATRRPRSTVVVTDALGDVQPRPDRTPWLALAAFVGATGSVALGAPPPDAYATAAHAGDAAR